MLHLGLCFSIASFSLARVFAEAQGGVSTQPRSAFVLMIAQENSGVTFTSGTPRMFHGFQITHSL